MVVEKRERKIDEYPLLDEYEKRYEKPPTDAEKRILFTVIEDIMSRKGWKWDWENEVSDATKEEILETNFRKIRRPVIG